MRAIEWDDVKLTRTAAGCLEWPVELRFSNGYGRYRQRGAHREAWQRANPGKTMPSVVRHTCDNPPCVEGTHLVDGDHSSNAADMMERGRHGGTFFTQPAAEQRARGEQNSKAKLTKAEVLDIRRRAANGELHRSIAVSHGVSRAAVSYIVRRITWAHVP